MSLFYSLFENIVKKINSIKSDFVGFSINPHIFLIVLVCFSFSLLLTFLSFSLGKKISSQFKLESKNDYEYLFFTAVGYVLIGSGIAILGLFSILNFSYITLYLALIIAYSFFFPFSLRQNSIYFYRHLKADYNYLKQNKFVFIWVTLFILIAILNLVNPEVREDQYHVDLPVIYLKHQTIMIPPHEVIKVSASPLLGEMYYIPGILYISRESSRYIHFIFYILVLLTLINFSKLKKYKFAIYTPLIFITAPVVIHETSAMYVDFEWIFCFLLSVLVLTDQKNNKLAILKSGLLFGGMLASKLWTIVFLIPSIFYLITEKLKKIQKIKYLLVFLFSVLGITSIWFIRAYILTGNPIFPAFGSTERPFHADLVKSFLSFAGINYALINIPSYINVFSPLFFLSLLFLVFKLKDTVKLFFDLKLFKYLLFLTVLYLTIHYPFGRYLLGLYALFIFLNAFVIHNFIKFTWFKIFFNLTLVILFSYYFVNSLLVLPYAFGISDQNKYLSRIFVRDNSSYYDFGHKFEKYISPKDKVAMFNFHGYYYANFDYTDVYFIFDNNQASLDSLKVKKYTKLLTRGGDIKWMCSQLNIKNFNYSGFRLISTYSDFPSYYLYNIN